MSSLGFCGDACSDCPRYQATRSNDAERLAELAVLWQRLGWRDEIVSAEEMACDGCSFLSSCRYDIPECAIARDIDSCGKCPDYPCPNLRAVFEKNAADRQKCQAICSSEAYALLEKAFFKKQENLERISRQHSGPEGPPFLE